MSCWFRNRAARSKSSRYSHSHTVLHPAAALPKAVQPIPAPYPANPSSPLVYPYCLWGTIFSPIPSQIAFASYLSLHPRGMGGKITCNSERKYSISNGNSQEIHKFTFIAYSCSATAHTSGIHRSEIKQKTTNFFGLDIIYILFCLLAHSSPALANRIYFSSILLPGLRFHSMRIYNWCSGIDILIQYPMHAPNIYICIIRGRKALPLCFPKHTALLFIHERTFSVTFLPLPSPPSRFFWLNKPVLDVDDFRRCYRSWCFVRYTSSSGSNYLQNASGIPIFPTTKREGHNCGDARAALFPARPGSCSASPSCSAICSNAGMGLNGKSCKNQTAH